MLHPLAYFLFLLRKPWFYLPTHSGLVAAHLCSLLVSMTTVEFGFSSKTEDTQAKMEEYDEGRNQLVGEMYGPERSSSFLLRPFFIICE